MAIFVAIFLIIIICFSAVLLFGAPYLPTLKKQIDETIKLSGLKPGQTMLELGCGDGRVLLAMAKNNINAVGYELNPILAAIAWVRCIKHKNIKIVYGNYWKKSWPEADLIFVFLLDRYMEKLDAKCRDYSYKPVKVISFAFKVPGKKTIAKSSGLYVYEYRD